MRLYAVAGSSRPIDQAPGHDAGLRAVSGGGVWAFVADDAARAEVDEDALWRHEEIVESLMAAGTILPARFGTGVDDEEVLRAALERHSQELRDALTRVEGCVELSVRALWTEPAARAAPRGSTPEGSGRAYMATLTAAEMQRVGARQRGEEIAGAIDRAMSGRVRAATRHIAPAPHTAAALAYLVERDVVEDVVETVGTKGATFEDVQVVCTGPWPPYSFANLDLHGGREVVT